MYVGKFYCAQLKWSVLIDFCMPHLPVIDVHYAVIILNQWSDREYHVYTMSVPFSTLFIL